MTTWPPTKVLRKLSFSTRMRRHVVEVFGAHTNLASTKAETTALPLLSLRDDHFAHATAREGGGLRAETFARMTASASSSVSTWAFARSWPTN